MPWCIHSGYVRTKVNLYTQYIQYIYIRIYIIYIWELSDTSAWPTTPRLKGQASRRISQSSRAKHLSLLRRSTVEADPGWRVMGADHERSFQYILGSHSCQCILKGSVLWYTGPSHPKWVQEFLPGYIIYSRYISHVNAKQSSRHPEVLI